MKIAIIGPAHPYKGGIVQQTTELAGRLSAQGHAVELIAWQSQFPNWLYPGTLLPHSQPEMPPFPGTLRLLHWSNPLSWRRVGRRLQGHDLVIFTWWVPTIQAPIYTTIKHYLRGTPTVVICHNVLPHETKPGDKQLASHFLRNVDRIIVHTGGQARLARTLTTQPVTITTLPPLLPGWSEAAAQRKAGLRRRLLFFGIVRDYKGLDILLTALKKVPDIALTVAGEFWGGTGDYDALVTKLVLTDRVSFQAGYIASERIAELFQNCDAVVLPYRSATGTTNVRLAFSYNVPVIASDIPTLAEQIDDGVNGLLFKNEDPDSLATTINKLYQPGVLPRLQTGIPDIHVDSVWQTYLAMVIGDTNAA